MNLLLFFGGILVGLVIMAVIVTAIAVRSLNRFSEEVLHMDWYR